MTDRERDWARWMRAAEAGDASAYRQFLDSLAIHVRGLVRGGFARMGYAQGDWEDVVQEILLAVHLKRHTWDPTRPVGPWVNAIARHKLIDNLRRHGKGKIVPIEYVIDVLAVEPSQDVLLAHETEWALGHLTEGQRRVVVAVAVEGLSTGEAAARLGMTGGAVRVALHRGLKALAVALRSRDS